MAFCEVVSWDSLANCVTALAKNRKFAAERGMSIVRALVIGLPLSWLSAAANSSRFASISEAIFISTALRNSSEEADH